MPTAVSAARQCLTEEASCAIDDAVAVARRRSHAQTSSLHAVSALLALPSSTLRDACTRARSCSYSPRRQFRALELSVGFSLDRIPTSKTVEDEPPISNSLMAAIKRSQANQRRHPDSFYLLQIHSQQQQAASFLKVELKHLILSILDDPIVSRVFGEAGFRSCDIKLAILQPPVAQSSRFPQTRSPPIFLCNLTGSDSGRPGFNFPFMGSSGSEDGDENCRRIGEVLVRKTGKNPLLLGVCAGDALRSFTESVQRGRVSFLPAEIAGLNVICIEKEISEFVAEGGSKEKIGLKFKELSLVAEQCSGPGVAVSFGELEAFVGDGVCSAAVSFVVSRLTSLLEIGGGKLWLVGASGACDIYSKFIALFPTVDKDWDLHLLPITSASPSMEGLNSKSSLMRSFIPFGGFFSTQSEFRNPLSITNQSFSRCHLCTEKYEHEVSDILKVDLNTSVSDSSASLPLLQKADFDTSKAVDAAKTEDGQASSNAKIVELQSKWNDICQHLHHTRPLPKFDVSQTRYLAPSAEDFRFTEWSGSRSKDRSLNESQYASSSPYIPREAQKIFPPKQFLQLPVVSDVVNINSGIEHVAEVSKNQQIDLESPWCAPFPMANPSLHDSPSSFSLVSVTTDLGLGTLYTSSAQEPNTPKLRDHKKYIQHLSDSISAEFDAVSESNSCRIAGSSTCFSPNSGSKFDLGDFKSLNQIITEKVGSQYEAICAISRSLSLHRSGIVKHRGSNFRRDIWFTFLGPDKVGKRKIASALGEIVFGNSGSIISVDFNSHDRVSPLNSIFGSQEFYGYDVKLRGKTIVDYIAGELRKKPHSVVFLENVDKADVMAQSSLSKAIRAGKFPDSHGREISINNVIFVVTSTNIKGNSNFIMEKGPTTFSEERILEAKTCQMQILLGHVAEDAKRSSSMNVKVTSRKETKKPSSWDKRKLDECNDSNEHEAIPKIQKQDLKAPRSFLDLNLPLEDIEGDINYNDDYESESITENSEAWLDDFFDQVNEKVVFKHFNFDELAEKVLNSISLQLQRTFGPETLLEIDNEVMVHILAAAWLSSDRKRAVEDWVDVVLGRSFNETLQKYNPAAQSVLKLVACEGLSQEEQAPGICLPAKINLN